MGGSAGGMGMNMGATSGFGDIFGGSSGAYVAPKQVCCSRSKASLNTIQEWLSAARGKGLEIRGTFARRNQQIYMDMTFTNRAMQQMNTFAIQLNKNRYAACLFDINILLQLRCGWCATTGCTNAVITRQIGRCIIASDNKWTCLENGTTNTITSSLLFTLSYFICRLQSKTMWIYCILRA